MKVPKIYLAGKIRKNDGWHTRWEDHYSCEPPKRVTFPETVQHISVAPPSLQLMQFIVTGPYVIGCDHGCFHGANSHGAIYGAEVSGLALSTGAYADVEKQANGGWQYSVNEKKHNRYLMQRHIEIRSACLAAIDAADIVLAWLEPEAYGTVAEIGYAHASNKIVVCAGPGVSDHSDLWFAAHMADCWLQADTPQEAIRQCVKRYYDGELFRMRSAGQRDYGQRSHAKKPDGLEKICESPVEKQFFLALQELGVRWSKVDSVVLGEGPSFFVQPQKVIGSYRLDFAFDHKTEETKIAVEIDGHDFHERTKEQAQRDKSRDRTLVAEGWSVLRFTGSEVYRDAKKCAAEAIRMFDEK